MSEHFLRYQAQLINAIGRIEFDKIKKAADLLFDAWQRKASVYIFGNGGSWSTAEHFACDLRKWSRIPGSGGVRAIALTLTPLMTAYANDQDYDEIFSRQLNDLMCPGDMAVGISCSGRSENVLSALHLASIWGKRIALTGRLAALAPISQHAEITIGIQAQDIRVVEDIHLAVCHILAGEVKNRIAELQSLKEA